MYTGACAVYFYVLPLPAMARVIENRVAADVAGVLLGGFGVTAVSIAILVSTFGCVNGLILGGGRVLYAMARDGLFFSSAGRVHPKRHTPANALILQGIWSSVLALSGSYSALLTYVTFASLAFNALTVAGLFVLREQAAERRAPLSHVGLSGDAGALPRRRDLLRHLHIHRQQARGADRHRPRAARPARLPASSSRKR